jgi:chaperonin GroEL (HSP60 family)
MMTQFCANKGEITPPEMPLSGMAERYRAAYIKLFDKKSDAIKAKLLQAKATGTFVDADVNRFVADVCELAESNRPIN